MQKITSRQNHVVRAVLALTDKKIREQEKRVLLEGENLIFDLNTDSVKIKTILATDAKLALALALVDKCEAKMYNISDAVSEYLSGVKTPAGIFAVVSTDFSVVPSERFVAVLDGVCDPGNMGTIIRTAAALGITEIYAINCSDFWNDKCVRASMGAVFKVNVHLDCLPSGYEIFALDMGGDDIFRLPKGTFSGNKIALIVGSEAHGLSKTVRCATKGIISLPMMKNTESLNAAVAFSVAAYVIKEIYVGS